MTKMTAPGGASSQAFASIAGAELEARAQLQKAERYGEGAHVIDELTSAWRNALSRLLATYSAPDNWHEGQPRNFIPRDVAAVLGTQMDGLTTAETLLVQELATARRAFDKNEDGGRSSACLELIAVLKHMAATRPNREGQLLRLALLLTDLAGLSQGRQVSPMFDPPKKNGRRRKPLRDELLRQRAAVAVSILLGDKEGFQLSSGKREHEANRYVAHKLSELGFSVNATAVGNWRDSVACEPNKAQFLSAWQTWLNSVKGETAQKFVDQLLAELKPLLSRRSKN